MPPPQPTRSVHPNSRYLQRLDHRAFSAQSGRAPSIFSASRHLFILRPSDDVGEREGAHFVAPAVERPVPECLLIVTESNEFVALLSSILQLLLLPLLCAAYCSYVDLSSAFLAERCLTDDLLPSICISRLHPCRMDPKVLRLDILINCFQPGGSWSSNGSLPVCWWSRSAAAINQRTQFSVNRTKMTK